jgi:hypothetical protein
VDDTDPPACPSGELSSVWIDEPPIIEIALFDAPALVKKMSQGVRSLSRSDATLCCAIARKAHEEGVAEGLRAARKLQVVLKD